MNRVDRAIGIVHRRLRIQRAVTAFLRACAWTLPFMLALLLLLQLFPVIGLHMAWVLLLLALPAAAALREWIVNQPTKLYAAIELDRKLGLRERISTACALADSDVDAEKLAALRLQAEVGLRQVRVEKLKRLFPVPGLATLAGAGAAIVLALLLVPLLPAVITQAEVDGPEDPVMKPAESQRVRETAKRLETSATRIAKEAQAQRLEALLRAAKATAATARRMRTETGTKRDAMLKMSRLSESVQKERAGLLGKELQGKLFQASDAETELSRLARELDDLQLNRLDLDLEEFKQSLTEQAQAAEKADEQVMLDSREIEQMLQQARQAREALERLEKLLQEFPELKARLSEMTERQRRLLQKIEQELQRLSEMAKTQGSGGC